MLQNISTAQNTYSLMDWNICSKNLCDSDCKKPPPKRGLSIIAQMQLLISGNGDLTYTTQHGSGNSEITGNRCYDSR